MGSEFQTPGKQTGVSKAHVDTHQNEQHETPGKQTRVQNQAAWMDSWGPSIVSTKGQGPTPNQGINQGGMGVCADSKNAAEPASDCFMSPLQRIECNSQGRTRVNIMFTNFMAAATLLKVQQLVKKPDELGFMLTMMLGLLESVLTAYGGSAVRMLKKKGTAQESLRQLGAAAAKTEAKEVVKEAVKETSKEAVSKAGKEAEKSMVNLTEVQLNSVIKTSIAKGKSAASSGIIAASSDESAAAGEKTQSLSYLDMLSNDAALAADALSAQFGEVSDAEALALWDVLHPSKMTVSSFETKIAAKMKSYLASPVSKIGRSMDWEDNGDHRAKHVEKEVRVVRVLVPGAGAKYAYQDRVFDAYLHDQNMIHPGTAERSGAYDSNDGALSLKQDATWTFDGKEEEQHHENPMRPDRMINYVEPEFEELALQKQEKIWQTQIETYQMTYASGAPRLVKVAGS